MSIELVGVTLSEPYPIGLQHIALHPGLNLLYGKNGVGKTQILEAVSRVLSGTNTAGIQEQYDGYLQKLLYSSSGVHVKKTWDGLNHRDDDEYLDSWTRTDVYKRWDQWIYEFLEATPWTNEYNRDWIVLREAHDRGFSEEQWRWLIDQGRWLIKPAEGQILLCDPDPMRSPLQEHWQRSQEWWAQRVADHKAFVVGSEHTKTMEDYFPDSAWARGKMYSTPGGFASWSLEVPIDNRMGCPTWVLTPLPEVLGFANCPNWVGLPVLCTDIEATWIPWNHSIWQEGRGSEDFVSSERLHEDLVNHLRRVELQAPRGDSVGPQSVGWQMVEERCREIENLVNQKLGLLFEDPPQITSGLVDREATSPLQQVPPVSISARFTETPSTFPIAQLGDAHRRYTQALLYLELLDHRRLSSDGPNLDRQFRSNRRLRNFRERLLGRGLDFILDGTNEELVISPRVAIIDEPERGLHPKAEEKLSLNIGAMADTVLAATHSLRFLNTGLRDRRAHLVERTSFGTFAVNTDFPGLSVAQTKFAESRLGIGPAEFVTLISAFVFVEGLHDKSVIETFLEPELGNARVEIIPIHGTSSLPDLISSPFIFTATSSPIIICIDNGNQTEFQQMLDDVKRFESLENRLEIVDNYLRRLRGRRKETTGSSAAKTASATEIETMTEIVRIAIERDRLMRIHPFFFRKKDILQYIPVKIISNGKYKSWDEPRKQFIATLETGQFRPGDGKKYKKWLLQNGIDSTDQGVRRVMKEIQRLMHDGLLVRHSDFDKLAEHILSVI